jgi:hypothetical protein
VAHVNMPFHIHVSRYMKGVKYLGMEEVGMYGTNKHNFLLQFFFNFLESQTSIRWFSQKKL